jgi:L-rhamnose-H+ transport protein
MAPTASGWALLIAAGAANATFGLPMKFVRRWQWENTWIAWTLLALVILPVGFAGVFVPSWLSIYSGTALHVAAIVCLLGVGWGLAQVLFGKAIDSIGIGLAFSIVLGISAAGGTLLPLLTLQAGAATPGLTLRIVVGLLLVIFGVAVCTIAGRRREVAQSARITAGHSFTPGLIMALVSGVLASFMNVGLSFAGPLLARASAQGLGPTRSMFAVWLPLLLGGALPNLLYCTLLLHRRKTVSLFRESGQFRNLGLATLMALLWFLSTVLYGVATQWLGEWGVVLGWPAFMSVIVITAGFIGIASGEWMHSGQTPIFLQIAGIFLLILAIIAFSLAHDALAPSQQAHALSQSILPGMYVR